MPNYYNNAPWSVHSSNIATVNIGGGVTTIGNYAFYQCTSLTSITIPSSVTTIGELAFAWCSSLASITIPNSVTTIGSHAFYQCTSLTSITIPNSVTTIGESAFSDCYSLTSITIGSSVTTIGGNAFASCGSLTSITIPNSVTTIGNGAFTTCSSLTSVSIGNSVTTIGDLAFNECFSLTSITVSSGNTAYASEDGVLFNKSKTTIILYPGRKTGSTYNIPNSVTTIEHDAFIFCSNLTSITIPNSVTTIGGSAFSGCSNLTSITIPNSVTTIGGAAFDGCSSLTSITIPNLVTTIGEGTFSDCSSLTSITIPNSVTTIGERAFWQCTSLRNVTILRTSPPTIDSYTFYNVPLSSVTLTVPQGSKSAYQAANYWKNFGTFVENVAVISVSLDQTSLNKKVGDSPVSLVATISPSNATNKNVSWSTGNPEVATVINGTVSFVGAGSTSITVTTQDGNKTATCDVTVAAATSGIGGTIGTLTWSFADGILTISGTGAMPDYTYTSYAPWYSYRSDITTVNIEEGVTTVGEYAFYGCGSITSVSISNTVTIIGNSAFLSCSGLTSITIPGSVTTIGNYAFNGCKSLTSIIIGNSVKTMGFYVFSGCSSLTNVTVLRTTPPPIDNNTFYGIRLSSVTLTVPKGSKKDYQSAAGWKDFGKFVEDGEEEEEERDVVVEAPKPEGNKGVIAVSLNVPVDGSFSCTFTITLPQGFTLDLSVTTLAGDLVADYQLDIKLLSGNTWQIEIRLKSQQNLRAATTYRNLVDVAYTIEESLPGGNHEVKLTDVELTMSDNTVIREDEIVVNVTTGTSTGIVDKAAADVAIRSESGRLYIDSPAAETVYIYSFTGKLLYTATKASGLATFDAPSEKLLIVRGTSGWTRKVSN
jgi:hypothetical protein